MFLFLGLFVDFYEAAPQEVSNIELLANSSSIILSLCLGLAWLDCSKGQ